MRLARAGSTARPLLALDVDGVILDTERGGRGPWQVAFSERFGVDASRLDEAFFTTTWADVIIGRRPIEPALADALRELGWSMGVDAALRCWFEEDFVVEPAVIEAVGAWADQGARLALVSNQEPRRAQFLQERLARLIPVGGVAFSGELGVVKKEPDFYDRAERHLGVVGLGRSVVLVDDTQSNVDAATRHGWTGVHFSKDRDWRRAVADALDRSGGGPEPA